MTKKIALIGCGNIGSRHLQALVKLPFSTEISIVEPNKSAQRIGVERLNQIKINKKKQNIFWYSSINELKNKFDVVIIATTAKDRVKMINRLLKMGNTRFLIEKIVCQSLSEYNILLKNIRNLKMELSDQEKLDVKNALNGKFTDNYDDLEMLLENLTAEKTKASDHGKFKRIDNAIGKLRNKMNRLKA